MTPARPSPAPLFLLLRLPDGIICGYIQLAVPYELDKLGLLAIVATTARQTALLPDVLNVFWAPALDARGTHKRWCLGSAALGAAAIASAVLIDPRASLALYTALLFTGAVGAFTSSIVGAL